MKDLGGRKFLLCCVVAAVASLLLWFTKIDAAVWKDVVIATSAIYIGGNVGEKYIDKRSA